MRPTLSVLLLTSSLTLCSLSSYGDWSSPHSLQQEKNAPVPLIPFPSQVDWKTGTCSKKAPVSVNKDAALSKSLGREGYELQVRPGSILIRAATDSGVFYARRTLDQLGAKGNYPCCDIKDSPAFAIRGFMHDTGRNFRPVETLKADIDEMARLKLNAFHWHLTDYPAWRIQSRKYPVLNDPSKRIKDRDVNNTYTYDQIRDLFRYARARHIQIIPEIDMPGHSTYFKNCFGFPMHDPRGIKILEELLEEFCREIPVEMSPYLHIGADEIHIPNGKQFADRMAAKVKSLGRQPIQWAGNNDLPVSGDSYSQLWNDENSVGLPDPAKQKTPYFDSTAGYVNSFDPGILVRRNFFRQPCGTVKSDGHSLGVIQCLWPDTRVGEKKNIPIQSPQWPAMFAMAERSWKGLPEDGSRFAGKLPEKDTEAYQAFSLFEKRMEALAGNKPFPYWRDSFVEWTVFGPVPKDRQEEVRNSLLAGKSPAGLPPIQARGGNLYFRTRAGAEGLFSKTKPGNTAWAETTLYAAKPGTMYAMVGFDAPARSTRRCSGIPSAGEWSQCDTRIWVNGKEVKNPQTCKLAGQRRYEKHTWNSPANEIPFDNEEFWWARPPVSFQVKAGENKILIEQPYTGSFQSWGISFIPVKKSGDRWISDPGYSVRGGAEK
ncbi:family 20 glycosylhydrolase [Akkermansia sp.]|uniref:family 20 glycosylhydrolase n=1 Tax=Akkermansia sp. TaxID=1872421 RepID=UPI003AB179D5